MITKRWTTAALLFGAVALLSLSCRSASPSAAASTSCDNDALTAYPALLVLAPHPDDEALGFTGLIDAYLRAGKPVSVVVVTDGDAYCEACRFWKSSTVAGPTCSAEELSNFATPEIDSFAEIRRTESAAAARHHRSSRLRSFLGYPDTGLGAAWRNLGEGKTTEPLRRSDFSALHFVRDLLGRLRRRTADDPHRRNADGLVARAHRGRTRWSAHRNHALARRTRRPRRRSAISCAA